MKFFAVFVLLVIFIAPVSVYAGKGCYDAREAEAEQGIRIHSELMVIGLNCMHMAKNGSNPYVEYKKFTNNHGELFAKYEKILMTYMRKNGKVNPDKAMHTLRTNLANKVSGDVAKMRPDIFCKTYLPRIESAKKMDLEQLRKWAATPYEKHPVSQPMCNG